MIINNLNVCINEQILETHKRNIAIIDIKILTFKSKYIAYYNVSIILYYPGISSIFEYTPLTGKSNHGDFK